MHNATSQHLYPWSRVLIPIVGEDGWGPWAICTGSGKRKSLALNGA